MHFELVYEAREDFPDQLYDREPYSDHPRLQTIEDFRAAVISNGFSCTLFGGVNDLIAAYQNASRLPTAVFINLSDGITDNYARLQAPVLLELMHASYSNSPPFVTALLNNKRHTKIVSRSLGVSSPGDVLLRRRSPWTDRPLRVLLDESGLAFPLIVKPNDSGSSLGISQDSVCHTMDQVLQCASSLAERFDEVLVEEYVSGFEMTNLVVGNGSRLVFNELLGYGLGEEVYFERQVMGLAEKAKRLRLPYRPSEVISPGLVQLVKETSAHLFRELGIRDIARFDYRISAAQEIRLIEINSHPNLGRNSEAGLLALQAGMSFEELVGLFLATISVGRAAQSYPCE